MHNGVQLGEGMRFRFHMGKWQFLNDNGDWVNVRLGTANRYAQSGNNANLIYQSEQWMNIFPNHNNLFQYYVDKIINEFCRLILNKPESKKIGDIIEYVFQNWSF